MDFERLVFRNVTTTFRDVTALQPEVLLRCQSLGWLVSTGQSALQMMLTIERDDERRHWRIVARRPEDAAALVVTRNWPGPWPEPCRPDDDLVAFIDPATDPATVGHFVNQLREAGHEVEISWPVVIA